MFNVRLFHTFRYTNDIQISIYFSIEVALPKKIFEFLAYRFEISLLEVCKFGIAKLANTKNYYKHKLLDKENAINMN